MTAAPGVPAATGVVISQGAQVYQPNLISHTATQVSPLYLTYEPVTTHSLIYCTTHNVLAVKIPTITNCVFAGAAIGPAPGSKTDRNSLGSCDHDSNSFHSHSDTLWTGH